MDYALKVQNLKKSYQNKTVLHDVSFLVEPGEIFALLGTNGAGKTTTLECVEGLKKKDAGTISFHGRYGVQLQSSTLPKAMKTKEALSLFAKWSSCRIDQDYLNRIGVTPFLNQQYSKLSTGQKRRLHLALAILGQPDILFLDEPTAGLDVEGRVQIHNEIRNLKGKGKTVVLTSHDMAEVEELCDRLAVLKNGRIVFIGTPAEMKNANPDVYQLKVRFLPHPAPETIGSQFLVTQEQDYFIFQTGELSSALEEILRLAREQKLIIRDIKTEQDSLEQRFLMLAREA